MSALSKAIKLFRENHKLPINRTVFYVTQHSTVQIPLSMLLIHRHSDHFVSADIH